MKVIRIILLIICIGFVQSCATVYDVEYHYDKHSNFSILKTYDWMTAPDNVDINSPVYENVRNAVDSELSKKGFRLTSDSPDFHIAQHFTIKDKVVQVNDYAYYYGPSGVYVSGYNNQFDVRTYEYEEESIVIDIVDAKSKKMIWRGSAKADVETIDSQKDIEQMIRETVKDILKNFPPALN